MYIYNYYSFCILAILVLVSCARNPNAGTGDYYCPMYCEGDKVYTDKRDCPICNMHLKQGSDKPIPIAENDEILETSVFNLTSKWRTEEDREILLKDLKGDILVVVMIYTTCKAACPRLVADMRSIEFKVSDPAVKYILVSIDPETDTPARLKAFAIENDMDSDQWTFLNGNMDDVRELSNVLAVKYKQISPIDFSHSNIISLFDQEGVLQYQQEGLGVDNKEMVYKITILTTPS